MDSLCFDCTIPTGLPGSGDPVSMTMSNPEQLLRIGAETRPAGQPQVAGQSASSPDVKFLNPWIRRAVASNLVLPLGVVGRGIVRRMIGQKLREKPHLRPVIKSIGKPKSASLAALIEMCLVTGTLQQATRISIHHIEQCNLKKAAAKSRRKASPKSGRRRGARPPREPVINGDSCSPTTTALPPMASAVQGETNAEVELEPPISPLPSFFTTSSDAASTVEHPVLAAAACSQPMLTFGTTSSDQSHYFSHFNLFADGSHSGPGNQRPLTLYDPFEMNI